MTTLALSYIDHSVLEDMFGADDADWAIYRKIVSYFIKRSHNFHLCPSSTPRLYHLTKKKTQRVVYFPLLGQSTPTKTGNYLQYNISFILSHSYHFIRYQIVEDLNTANAAKWKYSYYGVFDCHGGSATSEFVKQHLHHHIFRSSFFAIDIDAAISEAFRKVPTMDINKITKK